MADTKSKRKRSSNSATDTAAAKAADEWLAEVDQLSFNEARTALELAMGKLQAIDLEVEEMADLYQRAEAYANRCNAVLESVEQDVIQWNTTSIT